MDIMARWDCFTAHLSVPSLKDFPATSRSFSASLDFCTNHCGIYPGPFPRFPDFRQASNRRATRFTSTTPRFASFTGQPSKHDFMNLVY